MNSERVAKSSDFLELKERLIEENRNYWRAGPGAAGSDRWIYVYHGMSADHFDWAFRENIVAKGLQEKTGLPVVSVIDGHGHALPEGLDASFGIGESTHLFYSRYADERSEQATAAAAESMAKATYGDKDELLRLEYRGIPFGDELYDHLLFKNWQKDAVSFDCFDVGIERYAHDIRAALSLIDQAFALFEKRCPTYVVTTERIYLKRLFGSVAKTFGAKEIVILPDYPEVLVEIPADNQTATVSDICDAAIRPCVGRVKTNPETVDNLFVFEGESRTEGYDFREKLGITNENKNVFLFPHAFFDAPREGCRLNFYHDYREWFLETLRIVKDIPGVNWIVKDHPETAYYKQAAFVRKLFQENQTPNMYWCESDVSGMYIKDFADCLVTCGGEAALEYWAYGIPTVTTARTGFLSHGISYNMKSPEEYARTLRAIAELEKPSEESSARAREILLAMKRMTKAAPQDELAGLYGRVRKMQLNSYRSGLSFEHIPVFCEGYAALLRRGAVKESCIYQMRNVCEVSL